MRWIIHRSSRGASEHNTGCVIGAVDEPSPGPFDVLDARVVSLDLARRSTGDDKGLAMVRGEIWFRVLERRRLVALL